MDAPPRSFQIGDTISKAFSAWIANWVPFTLMSILVYSPFFVWTWWRFRPGADITEGDVTTWGQITSIGGLVLAQVLTGGLTYGVVEHLRGKRASLGACIGVGLSRLVPVLPVSLAVCGIFALVIFLAMFPAIALLFAVGTGPLFIFLLMLMMFVPVIWVACKYAVAVPVAGLEKAMVGDSLRRSAQLTRGRRMSIFIIFLVIGIVTGVAGKLVSILVTDPRVRAGVDLRPHLFATLGYDVLITNTLNAVANVVIYYGLRVSIEGAEIDEIAKVFD